MARTLLDVPFSQQYTLQAPPVDLLPMSNRVCACCGRQRPHLLPVSLVERSLPLPGIKKRTKKGTPLCFTCLSREFHLDVSTWQQGVRERDYRERFRYLFQFFESYPLFSASHPSLVKVKYLLDNGLPIGENTLRRALCARRTALGRSSGRLLRRYHRMWMSHIVWLHQNQGLREENTWLQSMYVRYTRERASSSLTKYDLESLERFIALAKKRKVDANGHGDHK